MSEKKINTVKRAILIVLDGVGCGELPDAAKYGDQNSNTLGNLAKKISDFRLPNLERWGLGNITNMGSTAHGRKAHLCAAGFGKLGELSAGKDTTTGHWEMAGILTSNPFVTFPSGFPEPVVKEWIKKTGIPGILGNKAASGTEIIVELGEEHLKTGKPILYTSADSVWQIAAHEEHFGLERLYEISKVARKICDEIKVSRVIARPFVGTNAKNFQRTSHRKDFSIDPPSLTLMEALSERHINTLGIGKISNIFAGRGVQKNIDTKNNAEGIYALQEALKEHRDGFLFVNLIDFDMLYGHRRDCQGFARALEEFDNFIPVLEATLTEDDLLLISSDHGNDPTYRGTDHTREYVPLFSYRKGFPGVDLGVRETFADLGQTIFHSLTGSPSRLPIGESFFPLYESC